MTSFRFALPLLLAMTWGGGQSVLAAEPLNIARVTPSGADVPAERQIVIEFDRPMVPLGRMERTAAEIPVEITPKVNCEWRWLNENALACQLAEADALKPSTHYQVTVYPGLQAEDGATLPQHVTKDFTTSRITLDRSEFTGWEGPGQPSIMLVFNQPVRRDSVVNHLAFSWADGERPVHVTPGPDWSASPDDALVKVEREPGFKGFLKRILAYFSWFRPESMPGTEEWARRAWVVTPKSALPLGTEVALSVRPGLIPGIGTERSVADMQAQKFFTYGEFKFTGLRCTGNDGKDITIRPGDADKASGLCGPWNSVRLLFSSPVKLKELKDEVVLSPALTSDPKVDPWASADLDQTDGFYTWKAPQKTDEYSLRFPIYLRSDRDYEASLKDGAKLVDMFGRPLEGGLSIRWRMDNRPPNFELPNSIAVLEKNIDSEVPLYVNNLTERDFSYSRLLASGVTTGLNIHEKLDPIRNIQYAIPFGVRDMLENKSGAILGNLTVKPKLPNQKAGILFAQVTPFSVHVKLAHYNTLVWVTDLATSAPIAGARVTRYKDPVLSAALCEGTVPSKWSIIDKLDASAVTDGNGLAVLPGMPQSTTYESACSRATTFRVQKDSDLALLPVNYQFEADTYRASGEQIWAQDQTPQEHMRVWGTTAQGVYRAGDTIQYKVYVRGQGNEGLTAAPEASYRLQLVDPTGKLVSDQKDVALNEFGASDGNFTVPKTGAVGWYKFRLLQKLRDDAKEPEGSGGGEDGGTADSTGALESGWYAWMPMQVLVSDFTPASFGVTATVNGKVFAASESAEVEGKAELHSGGPYTNAKARITAMFSPKPMVSTHPMAASFSFSRSDLETYSGQKMIAQLEQPVDAQGTVKTAIAIPEQGVDTYGDLTFEVAVADDRGKNVAGSAEAIYAATNRFVGLKPTAWLFQANKPASYNYIVVDPDGTPVKDTAADLKIERKAVTAARVKSAGSVYQTVYNTSWEAAGTCKGTPEAAPATCNFTPKEAGEYRITATVKGSNGKQNIANSDFWVTGSDVVLWDSEPDTALQMFPEKPSYKVGETARYLIKNPYPNAKALITIERYGVLDHFVQNFTTSTPVVEFPVKPEYAPGFYVSVVLVSPRVDKPIDANMVDLGKPAFRMGYMAVPVTDPYNEMVVKAVAEKKEYRPGDLVKVALHAEPRHPTPEKIEPVEMAVAVLDQAVFDLITGGKSYFDPYKGFYRLDNLDVRNYNLLLKLVGRQKFEKKGANPGGDGGADFKFRTDTKYVAYWNPSLRADANGDASIEFNAPDNLTGWRVLVLATTPTDRAGLGDGGFKVNRPTEIRPVMPNQVMEADSFNAGFSVMNRTEKKRTITVEVKAEGDVDTKTPAAITRKITLEPYARTTVFIPLTASYVAAARDVKEGKIRFVATAGDATDKDGYLYELPVNKRVDLVTVASYGTSEGPAAVESDILFPKAVRPDAGGLSVILSPTVVTDVAGAFRYIADYPFLCWEQRLTKAVMASNFAALKPYLPQSLEWAAAPDVMKDAFSSAAEFQAPNGGMTYWVASNERADPYLSAYTALGFGWMKARSAEVPGPVEENLDIYLDQFLRKDLAPDYYTPAMTASVRAVVLAAFAKENKVTLRDIERLRPHFGDIGLFGKAMLLQAALSIPDQGGKALTRELVDMILAHGNQTSGKLAFSESQGEGFDRILATPLRDNCAILSSFAAYGKGADERKYVENASMKLVRSISQSQRAQGTWGNTQENMFCANALADYAAAYESQSPDLHVSVALNGQSFGAADLKGVSTPPVTLERPLVAADLGVKSKLAIQPEGQGRLYYTTRLSYAPTDEAAKPVNSGIEIRREYSVERDGQWVMLGDKAEIARGELVRVDLYISLPSARNFVAVVDPVPGGLEPVNRDLATASKVDAAKADFVPSSESWWYKHKDWVEYDAGFWGFYHQELRHDSARFFSDYLGAGNYHLTYVAQAIATGQFQYRAVKAEEMYDPDVFGLGKPGRLIVSEKK